MISETNKELWIISFCEGKEGWNELTGLFVRYILTNLFVNDIDLSNLII